MNILSFRTQNKTIPYFKARTTGGDGLACLAMLLDHLGLAKSPEQTFKKHEIHGKGMTMGDVVRILSEYGADYSAYQCEVDDITAQRCPAILYWQSSRFVVLAEVQSTGGEKKYVIYDPSTKRRRMSLEEFEMNFSSAVLMPTV